MKDEFGPEQVLEVYDEKTKMKGLLVIHNTVLGPGKGGIRMTTTVTKDEIIRLANTMTWKCSLAGLPFGGAKGGIIASSKKITQEEKDEFIKAYARSIKHLCPKKYVAAPDVAMGEHEMEVFANEIDDPKSCTGKPESMGGLPHELGSTGFGVAHATKVVIEYLGLDIKDIKISIEGFGNVGGFTMKFLTEWGAKVVAVSDSKGCIVNMGGLDYEEMSKVKKETKSVINYKDGEIKKNEELFKLPVDIIIPTALSDTINETNWKNIKAKIIVEGSNIPMKEEFEDKFHDNGILIIPDFVANAGGVISSYVEYINGTKEEMWKLIKDKITKNTKIVLDESKSKGVKPRDAALEIAKERIRSKM